MADTLNYGFIKPQTGDPGSVFWPALEDNIQQTNDHTHNGSNSSRLSAASSTAVVQSVVGTGWDSAGGGLFFKPITLPSSLTSAGGTYDDYSIEIRNSANDRRVFLETVKSSATTFTIYSNDDSLAVKILYT